MSNQYVLDSFAILTLLQKEEGHDQVFEILKKAKKGTVRAMMTWVNLGEVAYIVQRRWDKSEVHQILANLESSNVEFIEAGGAGVSIGRNVFQYKDPKSMVRAISCIVTEGGSVEDGLKILESN